MIEGHFSSGEGRVWASVWLVASDYRARVEFLIDPSSASTVISTGDLGGFGDIVLDDLSPVYGVFGVLAGLRTGALLTFGADDGRPQLEMLDVTVAAGVEQESRLGRDILNRWLMIYDPQGDNLSFYPYVDDEEDGDANPR